MHGQLMVDSAYGGCTQEKGEAVLNRNADYSSLQARLGVWWHKKALHKRWSSIARLAASDCKISN
eukprot:17087-Heterococcus_DN1.PRE.1